MNLRAEATPGTPPGRRATVALVIQGAGWAGTERHVRGLLKGLRRLGWRVLLVTSEDGPLNAEAERVGAEVARVERPSSLAYVRQLHRLLRRIQPDLLHAHSGRLPCLAARLAGVSAIVETEHGLPQRERLLYRLAPWARRWEAVKSGLADRTVAVCRADGLYLQAAGVPRSRIRVIGNGLEDASIKSAAGEERGRKQARAEARRAWGVPEEVFLVGFIGRLAAEKAAERFLEVLAALSRSAQDRSSNRPRGGEGVSILGVLCGDGEKRGWLESRAAALGLGDRLRWLGPQPEAASLLPALDLLLLPSRREGCPYVLLEALQAGTPVLATPVGGVPEILEGPVLSRGCLPWALTDWAARAGEILASAPDREAWADAARRRAGHFSEEQTVAAVDHMYQELLLEKGRLRGGPGEAGGDAERVGPPGSGC